jgi:hypothetical protein
MIREALPTPAVGPVIGKERTSPLSAMGLAGTEVAIGRDETESQLEHASRFVAGIRKECLHLMGPE